MDPRTLKIYVNEVDSGVKQYKRISNTDNSINQSSRVYFLETSENGYTVFFGGYTDVNGTIIGRGVKGGEDVFVSYVNSSGSIANSSTEWTSNVGGVVVSNSLAVAENGYDSPDLDEIKFFAPREFSSGGRLVSHDDYINAISQQFTDTYPNIPSYNISV